MSFSISNGIFCQTMDWLWRASYSSTNALVSIKAPIINTPEKLTGCLHSRMWMHTRKWHNWYVNFVLRSSTQKNTIILTFHFSSAVVSNDEWKKKDVTWIWIRIPSKFIFISPQPLAFLGIIIAIKGCHMHISLPILLLREYINLYGAHSNRKAHKYSRIECRGDKSIDGKPIVAHRTPNRINISCSHSSANNIYVCNNTKYKYNPNTTHSYAFHTSDK